MRLACRSTARLVTRHLGLVALLVAGPAAHADNLVQNPGFEAPGATPVGWYIDAALSPKGTISVVPSPVGGAGRVLLLQPTAANTDGAKPLAIGQAFAAERYRGKRLYISARLAASGGASAVVGLFVVARDGRPLAGLSLEEPGSGNALQPHEEVLAVPDDPDAAQLILFCSVSGVAGAARFDDIVLATQVPARMDRVMVDAGPPLPATIDVDAATVVRKIPRTLYGTNTEWTWNAQGLWDPERKALQPDLVRLARDEGLSLVRFPGGTFSDFYHWRDGIGPQATRPETQQMPGDGKSRHVVGTDEIRDFAQRIGAGLLLTVNAGSGTAAEAAEWVRYVNAGPQRRPRVEYWEIGNELYLNDGSPACNAVTLPPDAYAERCVAFADAMRKVDPRIQIAAIGDDNYWGKQSYRDWTGTVLARAGSRIDYVAVHNAYSPMVISDGGRPIREVYAALLAAPVLVKASLDRLSAQIATLPAADARRVKIAVTEWGTLFHILPSSPYVDHCKTLGSALYTASVMRAFLETPRVAMANHFKLVDPLFIGEIGKRQGSYAPAAPYYALQLFARHFGSELVRSTATGPRYNSRAIGWVRAMRDVPYLEVTAARSPDGKRLTIMVINKHFDRAMRTAISIRGFRPAARGTAWTLNGTGIDANTGTAPLQAPGITWGKQAEDLVNPRFRKGGPGEVWLAGRPIGGMAPRVTWTFPAHSVTCLELHR